MGRLTIELSLGVGRYDMKYKGESSLLSCLYAARMAGFSFHVPETFPAPSHIRNNFVALLFFLIPFLEIA